MEKSTDGQATLHFIIVRNSEVTITYNVWQNDGGRWKFQASRGRDRDKTFDLHQKGWSLYGSLLLFPVKKEATDENKKKEIRNLECIA